MSIHDDMVKDLVDEEEKLEKLGLPKEVHDLLVLLLEQCYLKGRMRGANDFQTKIKDILTKNSL